MQWIAETVTKELSSADKSFLPAQKATTFAIIYGLPLLSYANLASKIEENKGQFETNSFYHQKQLATAGFTDINRPNVDTLYSEALVDLSVSDLILTLPEVPSGRFYVFPIYDVYGNNIVNLGTDGVKSTGRYLLTYRPADPGYSPGDDTYDGYVHLPTPYGAIDLRIEVSNTKEDVAKVNVLQVQFTLTPQPIPVHLAPKLTKSILFDGFSDKEVEKLLQLTARLSPYNLPEVGSDIARVAAILRVAGLSRGSYTSPSGVNLALAAADAAKTIASILFSDFDEYFRELGNGWSHLAAKYSGDFKTNYTVRAFVAAQGYLQLKADQAIYPIYRKLGGFTSDKSYTIKFTGKPPVNGFWSITVYDEKAYLIANKWNVYSLGDRSAIEYPNGSLVYPTSGSSDTDGEFSILLQTLDTPPPDKYFPNWIPTPASGQKFNFNLRWYGVTPKLVDGTYVYPTITTSEPITS